MKKFSLIIFAILTIIQICEAQNPTETTPEETPVEQSQRGWTNPENSYTILDEVQDMSDRANNLLSDAQANQTVNQNRYELDKTTMQWQALAVAIGNYEHTAHIEESQVRILQMLCFIAGILLNTVVITVWKNFLY